VTEPDTVESIAAPSTATVTARPRLTGEDAELFAAARLRAARLQPYMASAIFSLIPIPIPGYGTFGVDRYWRVYVDMDMAREWGVEATAGVLLHEVHHVVRDHHKRADLAGVRQAERLLWNLAGDAAINDDLVAAGIPLPDPVLPESLGLADGGIEETYFTQLRTLAADAAAACDCGSGAGAVPLPFEVDTDDIDTPSVDEVEANAIRREVAHKVTHAITSTTPPSPQLCRWAEALLNPQVPWRTLLRGAFTRSVRATAGIEQPTWSRPDRRSETRGDFLQPGHRRLRPVVAAVIDTSGSMSSSLLDSAVSELNALLTRAGCATVTVIVCDQQASPPQKVRRIGQLRLTGGGYTDLRIGISAAAGLRPAPDVIVVLTDGYTLWPRQAPTGSRLIAVVIDPDVALPVGTGITSLRIATP
jgi:predicted metal-dependent peptidase